MLAWGHLSVVIGVDTQWYCIILCFLVVNIVDFSAVFLHAIFSGALISVTGIICEYHIGSRACTLSSLRFRHIDHGVYSSTRVLYIGK